MTEKWTRIDNPEEARKIWEKENAERPKTSSHKLNMVVGGILPIWNRFNNETIKVVRIGVDDGRRFLGRQIEQKDLADTMKKLNVSSPNAMMSGPQLARQIMGGNQVEMSNGWKFKRVRVSNDNRIEVLPKGYAGRSTEETMQRAGVLFERIQFAQRYFVPTGEKAGSTIDSLMKSLGMNAIEVGAPTGNESISYSTAAAPSGVAVADLDKVVSAANALSKVNLVAVQSNKDLPAEIQSDMKKRGIRFVEGVTREDDNGQLTIYYVADNINGMGRLQSLMQHEWFHAGVADKELDALYTYYSQKNNEALEDIADARSFDLDTVDGRRQAAGELAAQEAEKGKLTLYVRRLVAKVKQWLRAVGVSAEFGDAEVAGIILDAIGRVTEVQGNNGYQVSPAYSVDKNQQSDRIEAGGQSNGNETSISRVNRENAAYIARTAGETVSDNYGTDAAGREQLSMAVQRREATSIREWAAAKGLIEDSQPFTDAWTDGNYKGGNEQHVIIGDKSVPVQKRKFLWSHETWSGYFQRLAAHLVLFPNTAYEFKGFMEVTDRTGKKVLMASVTQPFVEGREATQKEIADFMTSPEMGFRNVKNEAMHSRGKE